MIEESAILSPKILSAVLEKTEALIRNGIVSTPVVDRLLFKLKDLNSVVGEGDWPFPISFPLMIHTGFDDKAAPAIPVAVASTLLYLGLDLLDDLQDGDLQNEKGMGRVAPITLAAATLLTALPTLALSSLETTKERRYDLQKIIAEGLLRISRGQGQDLSMKGSSEVSATALLRTVEDKGGAEMALFGDCAACLAGASDNQKEICHELGLNLGTAMQMASDFFDLFQAHVSRDLANGTLTLPVMLYLERLKSNQKNREDSMRLLRRAVTEPDQRILLRQEMEESGALRHFALLLESVCQKAREALEGLDFRGTVKRQILLKIDSVSFASPIKEARGAKRNEMFLESTIFRGM